MSFRLPGLPQVGHGAWLGAYFTGMVRTWGRLISMACVLRGTWLGNHISQHAGFNLLCQWQLWYTETLSASARSVQQWGCGPYPPVAPRFASHRHWLRYSLFLPRVPPWRVARQRN